MLNTLNFTTIVKWYLPSLYPVYIYVYIYLFPEISPTVLKFHLVNLILGISRRNSLCKFHQWYHYYYKRYIIYFQSIRIGIIWEIISENKSIINKINNQRKTLSFEFFFNINLIVSFFASDLLQSLSQPRIVLNCANRKSNLPYNLDPDN